MIFIFCTFFPWLFSSFKFVVWKKKEPFKRRPLVLVSLPASSPFGGVARGHARASRESTRVCKGQGKSFPPPLCGFAARWRVLSQFCSLASRYGELARTLGLGSIFYLNGLKQWRFSAWTKVEATREPGKISSLIRAHISQKNCNTNIDPYISLWAPYGITFI